MILGCDGIWDVLSNQDAVDIQLEHPGSPKEAATAIVRAAYVFTATSTSLIAHFPRLCLLAIAD